MLSKRCDCPDPSKCWHPFSYAFVLHGKRYRKSTRTANKQTAERMATKHRAAVLEGRDEVAAASILLSTLVKDNLAAVKADHADYARDAYVLTAFLAFIGDRPIADVTGFAIEKWKIARAKQVKQTTVNRDLNTIKGMFSRAVTWKKLKVSPCVGIKNYKVDDTRIRTLSVEEITLVLKGTPPDVALICRTTLECLIRLNEVLTLRKEYIGPNWIEVRRKGGRVDRMAISADIRAALVARTHINGNVFGEGRTGELPDLKRTSLRIVAEIEKLGLSGVSHHTMRHTGITVMLEAGVNPRVIQRMAGWTSLRMLERYGHVRDAEMLRAVAATAAHVALATNEATTEKPADLVVAAK